MTTGWPWTGLGVALVGAASLHLGLAATLYSSFDGPRAETHAQAVPADPARAIELRPAIAMTDPESPTADAPTTEHATDASLNADALSTPITLSPPFVFDVPASEGRHYFSIEEVDMPAVPQPDWQVDVAMLLGMGVRSFNVNVLINDAGVAEQCAITRIEPEQSIELRQAVATKLCETELSPAMRRGVAVPSVRHIELLLATP